MISLKGEFIYVSKAAERISGYSPEDFYSNQNLFKEIIYPDDIEIFKGPHEYLNDTIQETRQRFRIITKSNKIEWIEHDCQRLYDNDGNFEGIRGSNRVITDKKELEDQVVNSEKLFKGIVENVPIVLWDYILFPDGKFQFTYVSPNCYDLYELTQEELLNDSLQLLTRFNQEDLINSSTEQMKLKKVGDHLRTEMRFNTKSGIEKWLLISSQIKDLNFNGGLLWSGFALDITEEKDSNFELIKSQRLLEQAEGISKVGSWEWDSKNDKTYWSEGLYNIFKLSPEEESPSWANQKNFYTKETYDKLNKAVQKSIIDGSSYEVEVKAICLDGEIKTCISRGIAEKNDNGEINRLWGTFQDITEKSILEKELKKNQSELLSFKERLEQTLSGTSSGTFSHDFSRGKLFLDRTAQFLLGIDKSEIIPDDWNNVIHPDDIEKVQLLFSKGIENHTRHIDMDYRVRKNENSFRHIFVKTILYFDNGKPIKTYGLINDITDQKDLEKEVLTVKERLSNFVDLNPAPIFFHELKKPMPMTLTYDEKFEWLCDNLFHWRLQ